jgi:hypothetical protein
MAFQWAGTELRDDEEVVRAAIARMRDPEHWSEHILEFASERLQDKIRREKLR